jgi:hypothetical protein
MSEIHELEKDERKTCPPRGGSAAARRVSPIRLSCA